MANSRLCPRPWSLNSKVPVYALPEIINYLHYVCVLTIIITVLDVGRTKGSINFSSPWYPRVSVRIHMYPDYTIIINVNKYSGAVLSEILCPQKLFWYYLVSDVLSFPAQRLSCSCCNISWIFRLGSADVPTDYSKYKAFKVTFTPNWKLYVIFSFYRKRMLINQLRPLCVLYKKKKSGTKPQTVLCVISLFILLSNNFCGKIWNMPKLH